MDVDLSHLDRPSSVGIESPYMDCLKCLSQIEDEFERIDWNNHAEVLLLELAKDKHWNDPLIMPEALFTASQELNQLLGKKLSAKAAQRKKTLTDTIKPEAIQFVREGVHILTHRLRIRSGEVRNIDNHLKDPELKVRQKRNTIVNLYDLQRQDYISRVERHYQQIAKLLACKKEIDRADAFLRLGIEAADYCSPQFKTVLAETQISLAEIGKDTTLENGILTILYERRLQFIQNILGFILKPIPHHVVEMTALNSPHRLNTILALYGRALNAETIGSEGDIEAKLTITEGFSLLAMPLTWLFRRSFLSKTYTKENILLWIKEEIKSGRIGIAQVQRWFEENESLSSFELIYDMDENDYSNIALSDPALIYMITKMGIFTPNRGM